MLGMPYLLLGVIGGLIYKNYRPTVRVPLNPQELPTQATDNDAP